MLETLTRYGILLRVVHTPDDECTARRGAGADGYVRVCVVAGGRTGTMWEHFHHLADIGVRGVGSTLEEAFAEGAYALMAVIASPQRVRPKEPVDIACEAGSPDLLFADWLNELIYEMETRGMLFSRFEVAIRGEHLEGRAWGEPIDAGRHEPAVAVKAATYMELKVERRSDGQWVAQCVVDV